MIGDRPFPLRTGIAEVEAVERVTPRMARITLTADVGGFPDEQPGEIITLLWPGADHDTPVLPLADGGWRFPEGRPGDQHERNFTIRQLDPDRSRMVIDFVIHGNGRACAWASATRPGDTVGYAGPRVHFFFDDDADWTLLAGDETALPSIAATLERMPAGHPARVFAEVADAAERQPLETAAEAEVVWIERDGAPPGRCGRLEAAIRETELPGGRAKLWVAGESLAVRPIREHLRRERGLAIGPMQAIGYWKHRDTPEDLDED